MPRPIFGIERTQEKAASVLSLTAPKVDEQQSEKEKMMVDKVLRKKRSKEYMEMLHKLDAGGHTLNQSKLDEIMQCIRQEFPEISINGILLGYVSMCYLGRPYEVHTLDITRGIVEHYKTGETLPNGMEKARGIAMNGGYEFIEVYSSCCRAISADGSVAVIPM